MTPAAVATPHTAHALDERFERVALDLIDPSKVQPRTLFPPDYLAQLTVSIQEKGVLEPILLRPRPKGRFEIVAGECRTRAAKLADLAEIPAVIRSYTDEQVLEIQLEENIHRKNLTPLEEAAAYRRLIDTNPDKHSAASIATRIGMSVTYVWDYLKLNDLIPEAKKILAAELMTVGHAILIARLKPADQERAIAPTGTGYGPRTDGLWRDDHGLDLDDEESLIKQGKASKYAGLKPCSVRELEAWIKNHVRFDPEHAAKAQPLVFEQTAALVQEAAAKPGRGKKVISITNEYRVADDARDENERTYGSQSWVRADGHEKSKTCEYSVLGVVAAGEGYGQTLEVCVNRDKCTVHFGAVIRQREKNQKLRDAGKGKQAAAREKKQEESYDAKWKREAAERKKREEAWEALSAHLIVDVVAQIKSIKALTPEHAKHLVRQEFSFEPRELERHLGKAWFRQPIQAILLMAALPTYSDDFADYVKQVVKPLGLNVKRLEAICDKHEPKKDAATPAKKGAA